jgi:DNA-binding PadR family transcriptional regulator
MFGKRFAFQFDGGNWQEGDFPWLRRDRHERHGHRDHHEQHGHHGPHEQHGHHGPHFPPFFAMRGRRGIFGPEGPFGPQGSFGPQGPFGGPGGGRFFGRGDVKYALLELLQERPMHGYEMMKALEEKSGGFYVPSAGSIYPTLQMLEDRGLVTVAEGDAGKKVYSITDTGRAFLDERKKQEDQFSKGPFWGRHDHEHGPKARWMTPEMQSLS